MRILKRILLLLVILVAVGLIVAAFMPKHFEYERSISINAPKEVVFGIVNDLKTQEAWGPWGKEDPTIKNTYNEVASGVGQVSRWTSEKSGNGSQAITESTAPTSVKTKLEFEGQGGGEGWFRLEDGENGATTTHWGMSFDAPWPSNLMAAMFAGGAMNKMFDSGLSSLKDMAEKKAAETPATPTGSYTVQELDFKGATYLGIRQQTTHAEVMKQEFFAKRFGTIMGALEKAKLQPAGLPAGVYYTWDEASKTTDMAVAIPVAKGTAVAGDPSLKTFEVPAGRALVVDYYGPYEGTAAAHEALTTYVKEKGLTEKAPVIEEYVTDPETEKDPTKWLTKVYYFVEAKK